MSSWNSILEVVFLFLAFDFTSVNPQREFLFKHDVDNDFIKFAGNIHTKVYNSVPVYPPRPSEDPNVISVPRLGEIRGRINYKEIGNRRIDAFRNLKYGIVKSGLGRFQRAIPVKYDYVNYIINAEDIAPNCPQFPDLPIVNASEAQSKIIDDCLTLNIYTPNKRGAYPVIIFVHGEMLFDGSAEEGQPEYFLEHDIVLVTVNYRLAPFGFLTTLTDEMPGNVALADLEMALQWIQEYIRYFGGKPDEVTLLGQAGGATLIHALSLSNRTQGLFHKLILQSGTALNPYFLDENPVDTARRFAHLGLCSVTTGSLEIQSLNECFGRMSTKDLLSVMKRFWKENEPRGLSYTGGFKLVIGDKMGFMEQHPAILIARSQMYYPTIMGVTKDAGAFIMSRVMLTQLKKLRTANISDYINVALTHITHPQHYEIWRRLAMQHIFDEENVKNVNFNILAQGILELVNLVLYRGPIIDSLRYSREINSTFLYCFDYRGEYHRFSHLSNRLPFATDATLSDDSIYLFPYPKDVSQLNNKDKTLSRAIITMWVNFVQYNMPKLNPVVWPNVTSEYGPFIRFTNSKTNNIELDYHFGEGIPVPSLYAHYLPVVKYATSTTTFRSIYNRPRLYETVLNNSEISL